MRTVQEVLATMHSTSEARILTQPAPPYLIMGVNRQWEALCGWTAREVLGQTCKILQGPETCRTALSELHAAVRDRRPILVRLANYTKSGQQFFNDLRVEPVYAGEGAERTLALLMGTLRRYDESSDSESSSTDLKVGFEACERSYMARLQCAVPTVLEHALEPTDRAQIITSAQPPYAISHVNEAWCQLCGFTAAEAVGRTCRILQGTGTCRRTLERLHAAAAMAKPLTVRLLNYTKDGRPFMNTLLMSPLLDSTGAVTHLLGVLTAKIADNDAVINRPPHGDSAGQSADPAAAQGGQSAAAGPSGAAPSSAAQRADWRSIASQCQQLAQKMKEQAQADAGAGAQADGGEAARARAIDARFHASLVYLLGRDELEHLISWRPAERAIFIANWPQFAIQIAPLFFAGHDVGSFKRALSNLGFSCMPPTSPADDSLLFLSDEGRGRKRRHSAASGEAAPPASATATASASDGAIASLLADLEEISTSMEATSEFFDASRASFDAKLRALALSISHAYPHLRGFATLLLGGPALAAPQSAERHAAEPAAPPFAAAGAPVERRGAERVSSRGRDDASSSTSVEPRTSSSSSSGDEGEAGGRSPVKVARRGAA